MSYPELYSDERVLLQAQNVKVKSVSFEIVLTTRRLVLIDTKKGSSIPPQEINLATLRDVESGENAIRDPTITISIITISGNTRQMVLTFSKVSGGERRRECDEWVRALRQNITTTVYHPVSIPSAPREPAPVPIVPATVLPVPEAPPAEPVPEPTPEQPAIPVSSGSPPPKKRIEVARPMKKIVEPAPVMPVPVETSSLPTGVFCNRCGNRVPPDSVFCNRCGTPIPHDQSPVLPPEEIGNTPEPAAPPVPTAVPQIQLTPAPSPVESSPERKERPIEEVIHSIEPLIEDSVPRTAPAPLVPARHATAPPPEEPAEPQPAVVPADQQASEATPGVQWPVLSGAASPVSSQPSPAPAVPEPAPPQAPAPAPRRSGVLTTAILIIIVLAVLGGVYVLLSETSAPEQPLITPTTAMTTVPTTITKPGTAVPSTTVTTAPSPVPAPAVPSAGVWVKITYAYKYTGSVGTPGRLRDISDTGSHLYQISTSDGPVVVSVQKDDGSAAELAVDVYKNGVLMKHAQTISPKGIIEMQTVLVPETTATTTAS